jgi:choice-of-anchor A domain-containing protein
MNLNSDTLTFNASNPNDQFVVNVAGSSNTISQSNIVLNGVSASQVLFNFTGAPGCTVEVNKSNSTWSGTILAPNCAVRVHNPFPLVGDIYGNSVQIDSAATIKGSSQPFCAPGQ